jgi:hypothetical protein
MPFLNLKTKSPVNNETLTEKVFIKTNNSIKINYIYTYLTHHHHDLTVNDYFDLTNIEIPDLTLRNKPFLDNLTLITQRNWTKIPWSRLQNGEWSYKTTPPNEYYKNVTTIESTVTFDGIQRPTTAVVCSKQKDDDFTLTEHFSDANLKCRSAATFMWDTLNDIDTKITFILPPSVATDFMSSSTAKTFLPSPHGKRNRRSTERITEQGVAITLLDLLFGSAENSLGIIFPKIKNALATLREAKATIREAKSTSKKTEIVNNLKFLEDAPMEEWIKTAKDAFQSESLTWDDLLPLRTLDYLFFIYFDDFQTSFNRLTIAAGDFTNNHNLQHYITNVELHGITIHKGITETLNEIFIAQKDRKSVV